MTPDWTTAPDWANYCAMDDDGSWYWYEDEPSYRGHDWMPDGQFEKVEFDGSQTLIERPK